MDNKSRMSAVGREERVEHTNLKEYNESFKGKVEPQNTHHNARKEGFARKEMQQNQ